MGVMKFYERVKSIRRVNVEVIGKVLLEEI